MPQTTPSFKSKQTTPAAQMGVAKSDFSQMHQSRSDLIMNVEHFAEIDLELKKNATIDMHNIIILNNSHCRPDG